MSYLNDAISSRRGFLFLVVAVLIGLAWYFRYQAVPVEGGMLIWDRLAHRMCISPINQPMRCSQ